MVDEVVEPNYEELAKADGWVPKDDWKGDPTRWADAKTFVERGATILPIVQAKYRKTLEAVDELKKKVGDLEAGNREFGEYHDKVVAREKAENERLITQLTAAREKAITDGDGQTFTKVDRELKEAERAQAAPPKLPADTQAWLTENTWYQTDQVLRSFADGLSDLVKSENPTLRGRAFLDKLTERVQAEMPHKFKNSRREETITEGHERKQGSNSKAKTFDNLPEVAKAACARYERTIPGFTKEKYLSQYDWE
jgi:hypothetical protein